MGHQQDLSKYRLNEAQRCLQTAKALMEIQDYKTAANRSYYCVYHCMRSVLALESLDFKRHSGVISSFREKYVKTGIFDTKLSKIIDSLFKIRSQSDYDDFYIVSKQEIIEQIENAEYFFMQVKAYLDKQKE